MRRNADEKHRYVCRFFEIGKRNGCAAYKGDDLNALPNVCKEYFASFPLKPNAANDQNGRSVDYAELSNA
jgi:hypothetical protein